MTMVTTIFAPTILLLIVGRVDLILLAMRLKIFLATKKLNPNLRSRQPHRQNLHKKMCQLKTRKARRGVIRIRSNPLKIVRTYSTDEISVNLRKNPPRLVELRRISNVSLTGF